MDTKQSEPQCGVRSEDEVQGYQDLVIGKVIMPLISRFQAARMGTGDIPMDPPTGTKQVTPQKTV